MQQKLEIMGPVEKFTSEKKNHGDGGGHTKGRRFPQRPRVGTSEDSGGV